MKKIIGLILCIVISLFTLVSCGDGDHVHKYNRDEWVSDATNHWYAAECDCEDAGVTAKAAHTDVTMKDGFCDICGYKMCNNTAYKTEYSYNASSHWKNPTCNHIGQTSHIAPSEMAPHTYIEADGEAICLYCGYTCLRGEEYSDEWTTDENGHWHEPLCGHVTAHGKKDSAAHLDVNTDGKCDTCEFLIPVPQDPAE